jgi:hypothetical protein
MDRLLAGLLAEVISAIISFSPRGGFLSRAPAQVVKQVGGV